MFIETGSLGDAPAWILLAGLPLILATCTAFTKVSVVLGALRTALGAEMLLPWAAIAALSLVITAVIMGPVALALAPLLEVGGALGPDLLAPLRDFLINNTDPAELDFFAATQGLAADHPLVVVPAFLVSELGEALHMAVVILLPFAIVDLIVAQLFLLLGLPNQPLALVSLPLKVLLFLAIGGWQAVISGLIEGYG
ncbi:MAG: EscR/YscR/HrcR family type III secretion system export apparatus protein [Myxococcales bacterium]|nr:EscR/YscR/HrcR family type III secretion system export apparatus protein [Myxococcales bacterium]